jgi:hypothetical protein
MAGKAIPADVKQDVEARVETFNRKELAKWNRAYSVRFRGRFAYLDRDDGSGPSPICRLEYMGKMTNWEFSIYKYSTDRYDPEECWFPGSELVDGTVRGAMRAGIRAYD